MIFRKIVISIMFAVCAAGYAEAGGDIQAGGKDQWDGFYGGLQAGWISIDNEYTHPGDPSHNFDIETDGLLVGILGGYNWRRGNLILGVEGDIAFTGADGSSGTRERHEADVDWFGTLRLRAGVLAQENVLIYATGGLAVMDAEFNHVGSHHWSQTFVGWTAGAGMEFATEDGVRLGLEALYVDFGSESDTHPHGQGTHTLVNDPSGVVGRVKIIVPIN